VLQNRATVTNPMPGVANVSATAPVTVVVSLVLCEKIVGWLHVGLVALLDGI
jgi:hypothetical protein